jgi:hypothetical protein
MSLHFSVAHPCPRELISLDSIKNPHTRKGLGKNSQSLHPLAKIFGLINLMLLTLYSYTINLKADKDSRTVFVRIS